MQKECLSTHRFKGKECIIVVKEQLLLKLGGNIIGSCVCPAVGAIEDEA